MIITVNLSKEQIERAQKLADEMSTEMAGLNISRSHIIGRAIDDFFLAKRSINSPKVQQEDRPAEAAA